jgi:hypothetical protein
VLEDIFESSNSKRIIKLDLSTTRDQEKYESFLISLENSMIHYSHKYLRFIEKITGSQLQLLATEANGTIQAALPYFVKESPIGRIINSGAYFGSHGGPIGFNSDACVELLESSKILEVSTQGTMSTTLITNPFSEFNLGMNFPAMIRVEERIMQVSPIPIWSGDFLGSMLTQLHPKTRNILRKSIAGNIEIRNSIDELFMLEQLHVETSIEMGRKHKDKNFFESMLDYFQFDKDFLVLSAYSDDGDVIASLLVFFYSDYVEYYIPAQNLIGRKHQAMTRLIFEAFSIASERGFKFWNWGGTRLDQESLMHFKSRWGTTDYDYAFFNIHFEGMQINRDEAEHYYPGFYVAKR